MTCPDSNPDLQNALNWQASPTNNGSPLSHDIIRFVGNPTEDDNHDDINNLLHFALTNSVNPPPHPSISFEQANPSFTFQRNLSAHLTYTVEYSEDLINWTKLDQTSLTEIQWENNGTALYTFQSPAPTASKSRQFFRLKVTDPL